MDPQNVRSTKWWFRKAIWQSEEFCEYPVHQLKTASLHLFSKWINFDRRHWKIFHCRLSKISLRYLTAPTSKATNYSPTVRWTSVGPSKCPIDKMIGWEGHLNVWAVPWVQHDLIHRFLQCQFFGNDTICK